MSSIDLTPEESSLLSKIVINYLSDLRMEIANTDQSGFKDKLRKEENTLNDLLKKLQTE